MQTRFEAKNTGDATSVFPYCFGWPVDPFKRLPEDSMATLLAHIAKMQAKVANKEAQAYLDSAPDAWV